MRGFCEFGEWADAETLVSDVARAGDKVMSAVLAGTLAQARGDADLPGNTRSRPVAR